MSENFVNFASDRKKYFFSAFLIFYAAFLSYGINQPFLGGTNDWNSTSFASASISWLKFGPANLGFSHYGQDFSAVGSGLRPYNTHPQFIIFPLWLSYAVFGVGEWQTRIVPIIFSLAAFAMFWFLIDLAFKKEFITVLSGFFYIFLPSSIYFGRMMSHEAITNFFILSAFLFLLLLEKNEKKIYLAGLLGSVFVGALMDWPMFYATAAIWFYLFFSKNYPERRLLLKLVPLILLFSFAITVLQISSSDGMENLRGAFFRHTISSIPSLLPLLIGKIYHEVLNFTGIAAILAVFGAILLFKKREFASRRIFVLLLFLPAAIHYAVFVGGNSHEFWSFYFVPFVALMSAVYLSYAPRWLRFAAVFYFLLSSAFYTYAIFYPRGDFSRDDIEFVSTAAKIPWQKQNSCIISLIANPSVDFYLARYGANEASGCGDTHYLLSRWDKKISDIDWNQYGILRKDFFHSVKTAGFEIGVIIEILKMIPSIKEQLAAKFGDWRPVREEWSRLDSLNQNFIRNHKLAAIECSPNFCLYNKPPLRFR